jgi:hypothetical protein
VFSRHIRALSQLGIVAAAVGLSGASSEAVKPFLAYHNGSGILFTPHATGTRRPARFGPWNLGERLEATEEKPRDKRLNLYVIVPGSQYHSAAHPEYDHNLVVNKYTVDGKPREWDIFWCFVLDPNLPPDLRSEHDILLAAHQSFFAPEFFSIQDVPANAAMAEKLDVTEIGGLRRFRHKDGSLPRMLIIPARLAVRATAEQEDLTPDGMRKLPKSQTRRLH